MAQEQYVCTVCGFNMVGYHPERCPFCGAPKKAFLSSEDCSARYNVLSTPVTIVRPEFRIIRSTSGIVRQLSGEGT